jgi:hypothetical protein
MARMGEYVRYVVPEAYPAAIIDLGPVIDPPFRDGIARTAPDAAVELVDYPFERVPDRLPAELAARARRTAESDRRVAVALGRRHAFIGAAMSDAKREQRPVIRVVWYAYDTDRRVEAATDEHGTEVLRVLTDACQPALTREEEARANQLVARNGQLPEARDGRGLIVEETDPGSPRHGHRLVDLRFDPYGTRLPHWWAVVDLSAGEVVEAGRVPESAP